MNTKYNTNDDKLKSLFSGSKIQASENLKYRIMQQVKTEAAIKGIRKKEKNINSQIRNIITIVAVMYGLIGIASIATYLYAGQEALISSLFLMVVAFITVVAITFGVISYFDGKLRSKIKN